MKHTIAGAAITAGVIAGTAMPASAALSPGFSQRLVSNTGISHVATVVTLPPGPPVSPPSGPPGGPIAIPYPNFDTVIVID